MQINIQLFGYKYTLQKYSPVSLNEFLSDYYLLNAQRNYKHIVHVYKQWVGVEGMLHNLCIFFFFFYPKAKSETIKQPYYFRCFRLSFRERHTPLASLAASVWLTTPTVTCNAMMNWWAQLLLYNRGSLSWFILIRPWAACFWSCVLVVSYASCTGTRTDQ